jgi:hypothetical protein
MDPYELSRQLDDASLRTLACRVGDDGNRDVPLGLDDHDGVERTAASGMHTGSGSFELLAAPP